MEIPKWAPIALIVLVVAIAAQSVYVVSRLNQAMVKLDTANSRLTHAQETIRAQDRILCRLDTSTTNYQALLQSVSARVDLAFLEKAKADKAFEDQKSVITGKIEALKEKLSGRLDMPETSPH